MEALAYGEGGPLVERTDKRRCAICHLEGTLRFLTFPLKSRRPLEMDLCAEHIRGLVARRLGPHGYEQIRRQLRRLGLDVAAVFMLHEAFYDATGHALQPVAELA